MSETWFITGASGYVGRHLLRQIGQRCDLRLRCLVRRPDAFLVPTECGAAIEAVVGDLLEPEGYRDSLAEVDAVVHMAAVTGKAKPADYFRINVDGTRRIVETCLSENVGRFLFVSTIAAGFRDQTRYFYAQSKRLAEDIITASGLSHTIVRPTIVLGSAAPVLEGLKRLARMPIMPVFGDGRRMVQPILVNDLVDCILAILNGAWPHRNFVELGGPDVLTIEELLNRIRQAHFGNCTRAVHLPLRPIRTLVSLVERCLLPIVPITAGQMALFANDSVVESHGNSDIPRIASTGVEAMLRMNDSSD